MEILLTPNPYADSNKPKALHVPTEVCEHIIDMLYSISISQTFQNISTLHACALVCRAWRIRSQRRLFYKIQLSNTTSFHRLAAILDTGQHLREYVHQVVLTGYHLHTTTSIFMLFPVVFGGKLPNLRRIDVSHFKESLATWYPRTPDPPKFKPLPYIPLHPRFPAFLSPFTAVACLLLRWTTFRSFSEFARVIHGLPNLEELICHSVHWMTLGGSYPGADFTKQRDEWAAGMHTAPALAPKLRLLRLWDMEKYGIQTLIWTRGPHLRELDLTIPLSFSAEDQANGGEVDLHLCTGLRTLVLRPTPQFSVDKHATLVTALLVSWNTRHSRLNLTFSPFQQSKFTRRGFEAALHGLGRITQTWIQILASPSSGSSSQAQKLSLRRYRLCVEILDWEDKKAGWSTHLDGCFPNFARKHRLNMDFRTPPHKYYHWAIDETPSPSDAVLPSASENDTLISSRESQDVVVSPANKPRRKLWRSIFRRLIR